MRWLMVVYSIVLSGTLFAQESRQSAERYYQLGQEALSQGRLPEARDYFSKAIAENPGFSDAYTARARVHEKLNNYNSALLDYGLSLELVPDQFEVLFSRAILRYQLGQYVQAQDDFRKLFTIPDGETNTVFYRQSAHSPGTDQIITLQTGINDQLYNYLGLIELKLNNCRKAILYLDSAVMVNSQEADYYVNRALARKVCGDAEATTDFRKALQINPYNSIARHNLAVNDMKSGSYDSAEKELSEVIESDPMLVEPYLERGYYRMQHNRFKESLKDYDQAIKLDSLNPDAWLNRGMVKAKLTDRKGALLDITFAIELKPDYSLAWLNRGNVLASLNRYKEAIDDYSVALLYEPNYSAAYYNRALAEYRLGNRNKACLDLKKALSKGMLVDESVKRALCGSGNN